LLHLAFAHRYLAVTFCLLIFACCLLPASLGQHSAADSWTQFRGNHALTGVSQSTPPATLKLCWTYEAGESSDSSIAIADGTVFVGSQSGDLIAVDLQSGKARWKYRAAKEGIGESSPAVSNGVVYVGDLTGVLHAVNARDGKGVWTFKTESEIKSSPV